MKTASPLPSSLLEGRVTTSPQKPCNASTVQRCNASLPPAPVDDFNTATIAIAQQIFFDVLNRFDSAKLTEAIEEKPELWFQLINAFCNFSRLQLAREKFEWQKKQAEAKQREEKQRTRAPGVITADAVHALRALFKPVANDLPAAEPIDLTPSPQPPLADSPTPSLGCHSRRVTLAHLRLRPVRSPRPTGMRHIPPVLVGDNARRKTPTLDPELSDALLIPSPS